MFKLTIEFKTKEELASFLTGGQAPAPHFQPNVEEETTKTATKKATKKKEEPVAKTEAVAPVKQTTPTPEPDTASGVLDYQKDVTPVMVEFSTMKGRDAFTGLLDSFGVSTARDLEPGQYAAFVGEMKKQLAA